MSIRHNPPIFRCFHHDRAGCMAKPSSAHLTAHVPFLIASPRLAVRVFLLCPFSSRVRVAKNYPRPLPWPTRPHWVLVSLIPPHATQLALRQSKVDPSIEWSHFSQYSATSWHVGATVRFSGIHGARKGRKLAAGRRTRAGAPQRGEWAMCATVRTAPASGSRHHRGFFRYATCSAGGIAPPPSRLLRLSPLAPIHCEPGLTNAEMIDSHGRYQQGVLAGRDVERTPKLAI